MNIKDIKRPEIISIDEDDLRFEISAPIDYLEKETNELADILIAPTLVISKRENSEEKFPVPIDTKMFSDEIYKRFNGYTFSLGKMVRLAELNLDFLIDLISRYIHLTSVNELLERNSDCKKLKEYGIENNFNKLTFGNLRSILSCIIKTDPELHQIPGLTTPQERKNFTSVYKNYIDDRDRYTHGILFFLYPLMEPILRVKNHDGTRIYIKYEKVVFSHNLMTHNYLTNILSDIRDYLQTK